MPVVSVKNASKSFGPLTAVSDASFTIEKGECFGLLGPNGAGKSTLIRMLYGASARSGGDVTVLGLDPAENGRALRRRLGVVTQEDALDEAMSVAENMYMFAHFIGIPKEIARPRVDGLLKFLSLDHKADAKIITLSGGMKRRLVFVRALIAEPELLILDEPTTGLDPAVRQVLWDKIRELKAKGTTVLLTTHYMDEAEVLCDRLVILDKGKIQVQGAPRALIAEHCPGYVALWKPSVRARAEARTLHDLAAEVERETEKPEMIRPSNLEDVFLKITGRELSADA